MRRQWFTLYECCLARSEDSINTPARANYVEHEIERLIVAYLGADIELITSGVVQQVLDSRAFKNYLVNPKGVTEDIEKLLKGPKFLTWQTGSGASFWIMAPGELLDSSLDAKDRARYYIFDLLREKGEVTEGAVRQHLLTLLSREHDLEPIFSNITTLLRSVGKEVRPHVWQFDPNKVTDYKQLRLLFRPSRADRIRDWIEHRQAEFDGKRLRLNPEGFALLNDLLSEANNSNQHFERQYSHLRDVLQTILWRLESSFGEQIERVMAVGEWAHYGIDLHNLPYDDVLVQIVLLASERPFRLYQQIAEEVFNDLPDEDILLQFRLLTLQEWQHAEELAQVETRERALGITLLDRL